MAALRVWDIYPACVWQQGNNCGTNLMSRATTAAACLSFSAGGPRHQLRVKFYVCDRGPKRGSKGRGRKASKVSKLPAALGGLAGFETLVNISSIYTKNLAGYFFFFFWLLATWLVV